MRVFTVAGIVGVFVLVPVNYLGDQLSGIDFADIPNKSLDLFSISNVKDGSNRSLFIACLSSFLCRRESYCPELLAFFFL